MKKILSLALAVFLWSVAPVMAQQIVLPCVQIPGTGVSSCAPVTNSNPLPIAVYDAGNHSGYCYTSNGSASPATFQVCGGGGGSGTVTSVTFTGDGIVDSSTPSTAVTTSGTVTATALTQAAHSFLAGPTTGGAVAPTFRSIAGSDLPNPSATTLGGIESITSAAHNWVAYIDTSGVPHQSQPAFSDISGNATNAQLATQTANTVLGALTATTPSGLAVPSCSGSTNALTWTSGTGFGCNTISGGSVSVTAGSSNIVISPSPGTGTFTVDLGAALSVTTSVTSPFYNATTAATGYEIGAANALSFNSADSGTAGSSLAVGVGALSGQTSSAAYSNTAVGYQSLHGTMTTAAIKNTMLGYQSGTAITTGNLNTYIGYQAGSAQTTATNNVLVGSRTSAGTGGGGCVAIGDNSSCDGGGGSNTISIGQNTQSSNSGSIVIGQSSNGSSNGSVTIGQGLTSSGNNSIAINAQASANSAIAIGGNAGTANEINLGGLLFLNNNSTASPAVTLCGTETIDSHANNKSGTVNITAGTPSSCTITFAGSGYVTWNHCRVTSESVNAAFAYSYSLTVLTVTGTALAGKIDYDCDGV